MSGEIEQKEVGNGAAPAGGATPTPEIAAASSRRAGTGDVFTRESHFAAGHRIFVPSEMLLFGVLFFGCLVAAFRVFLSPPRMKYPSLRPRAVVNSSNLEKPLKAARTLDFPAVSVHELTPPPVRAIGDAPPAAAETATATREETEPAAASEPSSAAADSAPEAGAANSLRRPQRTFPNARFPRAPKEEASVIRGETRAIENRAINGSLLFAPGSATVSESATDVPESTAR